MTKKLLPAMIGMALVGSMAAAQADVTVFGHLDASVVNWDDEDGWAVGPIFSKDADNEYDGDVAASPDYDGKDTNFRCTTCSLGFKGSEDLGNGLQAVFKLDFQFDMFNRNSGNAITDRDQYMGLAGNFGQVVFGTMSTVYKSTGAMLDPGYRTVAQMRDVGIQSALHSGAGEEGQGRADNSMRYDSPDWNGLKASFTYTLDSDETDGEDDNPYSVGAQYTNGGILVFADYITNDQGGDDSAWKVGGKFSMDNFAVFGQYEKDNGLISFVNGFQGAISDGYVDPATRNDNVDGADLWMLGGSFTMGNNTIYGAYSKADDASGGDFDINTEWNAWEIVGIHSMSKQTLVYGGYIAMSPDDNSSYLDGGSGLGDDVSIWTVGMKHKF
jgi:predicted porin